MQQLFSLIILSLLPLFMIAQTERNTFLFSDNFSFLYTNANPGYSGPSEKRYQLQLPSVDYFFADNWSIGGELSLQFLKKEWGECDPECRTIITKPHLKYWRQFTNTAVFLTASGLLYDEKSSFDNTTELVFYTGMGLQFSLAKNIGWNLSFEVPIWEIHRHNPRQRRVFSDFDYLFSTGLKFGLNNQGKELNEDFLVENYRRKGNLRIGMDLDDFRGFTAKNSIFSIMNLSLEIAPIRYISIYSHFQKSYLNEEERTDLDREPSHKFQFVIGLKGYLPIGYQRKTYVELKAAYAHLSSDNNLFYIPRLASGYEWGISLHQIFKKNRIVKTGIDWLYGTNLGWSSGGVSNFQLYGAYEIFLSKKLSFEPRIIYQSIKIDDYERSFAPFKNADTNLLVEFKFNTLFSLARNRN